MARKNLVTVFKGAKIGNMKVLTNYIRSSLQELTKVTWPTQKEAIRSTIIVLVFCLVTAAIFAVLDFAFGYLHDIALGL